MSTARTELQEALSRYITDTLTCVHTVSGFCQMSSKWILCRQTELAMMRDIKDRVDKLDLLLSHVTKSKNKGKAFVEYMRSKFTMTDSRYAELEKDLVSVLKDTLEGLEKLDCFLDAVEKLAVTSLHVFTENQVVYQPEELSCDDVHVVITAAQLICPLLLEFKRDAKVFFLPKHQNLDVLIYQLDKYIQTAEKICINMETSCLSDFSLKMINEVVVNIDEDLSENDIHKMLDHINQLDEIRMDPSFRTVFLFQDESHQHFTEEFSKREPRMLEFLNELESNAVQLARMNKGAKISNVAGSSLGAVGGVLSIVGLALSPVTAGVSLGLTMTGLVMGITSGVNSIVTTATEVGVNHTHQKKADEVFQNFMEDVQVIQDCLEEVIIKTTSKMEASLIEVALGAAKVAWKVGTVGRGIDAVVDAAAALKLLRADKVSTGAVKVVGQEGKALRNVPRVAAEIPDAGQAAAKGALAVKAGRAGLIAVNAIFIGMDIFFICKESISLAKGSKTEVSEFIRARAALWSSEIDSWKKIYDSLCKGLETSGKKETVLETPFYTDTVKEEHTEKLPLQQKEEEVYSDEVNKLPLQQKEVEKEVNEKQTEKSSV